MAEPTSPQPVMLIVAAFSRWPEAIDFVRDNLQNRYGPIVLQSPLFEFVETSYYDKTMGTGLQKKFLAFERLIQPVEIVSVKIFCNDLERQTAQDSRWSTDQTGIARPVNLDPGYLNAGKWVLATTKDQAHRLYLGQGIFAEVTLRFERGEYQPWPWTYPNYRRDDYRSFFNAARAEYMRLLKVAPRGEREK